MKRVFTTICLAALLVLAASGGVRAENSTASDALMKAADAVIKAADATAKAADVLAKADGGVAKGPAAEAPAKAAPQSGNAAFIPMDPTWIPIVLVVLNVFFLIAGGLAYNALRVEKNWSISQALSEPLTSLEGDESLKALKALPCLQQTAVRANEDLFYAQAAANASCQAADAAVKAGAANASTLEAQAQSDAESLKQAREQARKALDELAKNTGTLQLALNTSKENMVSSSSRLIGFIAMLAMVTIFIGVGDAMLWSLLRNGVMPTLGDFPTFFGLGATLFLPYGFNQFRTIFTNK